MRLNAPGRHMAMNAIAALGPPVAALGFDPVTAAHALEAFSPLPGRGAHRRLLLQGGTKAGGPALLLDESYNANGASMRAALEVLRLQPATRRVAILGDMLELGDAGPKEHAALAEAAALSADLVFTCGPLMRHLFVTRCPRRCARCAMRRTPPRFWLRSWRSGSRRAMRSWSRAAWAAG